jgi:hypothetical protein
MALSLNNFSAASVDYHGCCVEDAISLAQAFTPGDPRHPPDSPGPFRGQGSVTRAPKGAKTEEKGRFSGPRRKRLGYINFDTRDAKLDSGDTHLPESVTLGVENGRLNVNRLFYTNRAWWRQREGVPSEPSAA